MRARGAGKSRDRKRCCGSRRLSWARHLWWRSILRLGAADPGVAESAFLHELIEVAACRDRLNLAALECFELVSRRLQLWEETYCAQLRRAESGDTGTAWLDERAIFLGAGRSRGHALVCPNLEIYVAEKLASESAVLKERRKGREERQLAAGVWGALDGLGGEHGGGGGGGCKGGKLGAKRGAGGAPGGQ